MTTNMIDQQDRALTPAKTAELLAVSLSTVWRMLAAKEMTSIKIGKSRRIMLSEVQRIQREGMGNPLDDAIKRIVDQAPELTSAQRDILAALLAPARAPDNKRRSPSRVASSRAAASRARRTA